MRCTSCEPVQVFEKAALADGEENRLPVCSLFCFKPCTAAPLSPLFCFLLSVSSSSAFVLRPAACWEEVISIMHDNKHEAV